MRSPPATSRSVDPARPLWIFGTLATVATLTTLAAFAPLAPTHALHAQETLERTAVHGADGSFLYGVVAGAAAGAEVSVLTEPEPAVHLYGPDGTTEWGREGQGPAELQSPVDITWENDRIHVLDIGNRKFVRFDREGGFEQSRGLGDAWARTLDIVRGDTVLGTFVPMTDARAVVRVSGQVSDTLLRYRSRGEDHRLEAPGAPSLTVKAPFSAQLRWTATPEGGLAWYDPGTGELVLQDRAGVEVSRTSVPWGGSEVTEADREWWIANRIPADFQGRAVFEPLRDVAREELDFPERHAPVLALERDPAGGVWVKRTLESEGERWTRLAPGGAVTGDFRLPPGRRLIAISEARVFAVARDALDVETVEAYGRAGS